MSRRSALVGAVAADADQALDAEHAQVLHGLLLILGLQEIQTARRAQKCAAAMDLIRDAAGGEDLKVVMLVLAAHEHAVVTALEADDRHLVLQASAHHRADGGIHARRVSAGGQYADSLHLQAPS